MYLYIHSYHQAQEVIFIPTRNDIYSNEATEIISEISTYPGILEQQIYALHPGKEAQARNLISYFIKQERIRRDKYGSLYPVGMRKKQPRDVTIRSVWVLLDFLSDVEYHCAGNYPIIIVFLLKGKEYQILYAAEGYEAVIGASVNQQKDSNVRRIILVDSADQISKLILPGVVGYCTVDANGHICYYKSQS